MKSGSATRLSLGFGFRFEDLYDRDGLMRLDQRFLDFLEAANAGLAQRLIAAREKPGAINDKDESQLLMEIAGHLDDFLAQLFEIDSEVTALSAEHHALAPLYKCKRQFVQRKAITTHKAPDAEVFDGTQLEATLVESMREPFSELAFARHVQQWQEDGGAFSAAHEASPLPCHPLPIGRGETLAETPSFRPVLQERRQTAIRIEIRENRSGKDIRWRNRPD